MLDLYRTLPDVEAVGVDRSPEALGYSRGRGHARLAGSDLTLLPFRSGTFDAVTALDVIEHIQDDRRALEEISRVLRPGGILVATVPAYQFLWGRHDEALHHQRRYRGTELRDLVNATGLRVEKMTYLLAGLFPLAAAARLASKGRKSNGAEATLPRVSPLLNQALVGFQAAELEVARRVGLPFGLSVLVVARKPVPARIALSPVEERVPVPAARW
jgi:SAM-dependent methyltransferase